MKINNHVHGKMTAQGVKIFANGKESRFRADGVRGKVNWIDERPYID